MKILLRLREFLLFALIFSSVVGCSTFRKVGIDIASGGMKDASKEIKKEYDYQFFKESIPANLKLMETLLTMSPENEDLLSSLIQGYVGYAYAIHETQYLDDYYKEVEGSIHLRNAISLYSKAVEYGFFYFSLKGISREGLLKKIRDEKALKEYIADEFDEDDYAAVFFTAQAWGSLINLQRTNMSLMSELPAVKALFDFVCGNEPNFEDGACDLFYGSYEVGRPKMLGGNPAKGKTIFKTFIEKNPYHLLALVTYLQLVVVPNSDEEEFNKQSDILNEKFELFNIVKNKGESFYKKSPFFDHAYLHLFNAVAQERYKIMQKYKKELF